MLSSPEKLRGWPLTMTFRDIVPSSPYAGLNRIRFKGTRPVADLSPAKALA
jgi:hypothetical protein